MTVTFTCSDDSGISSCSEPVAVSTESALQTITGKAVDNAGNTATTTVKVSVDKSTPSIIASATPQPNAAGWNNANVTVSFACTDSLSGVGSCQAPKTVTTDGANQTVKGTALDNAGNTATATALINLDKTAPTITSALSPSPNGAGWNNANVTVSFTCNDSLSGVGSCQAPINITTEGANQNVNGTAKDNAGNTATATAVVNLDKTAPTITSVLSPSPNGSGWNNANVTVSFTCNDSVSGVDSCQSPINTTTEGANQNVNGTAKDNAGNTATATAVVNLDKTAPTITSVLSPSPNGAGWNNTNVTVDFTCSDTLSGVASCPSPATLTSEGAAQTTSASATDRAGNSSTTTVTAKIDKTAPDLSTATIPPTASSPSLSIHGSVSDSLSGVLSVRCNGANASVAGTDFNCTVNLIEGPNAIDLVASDQAGNTKTVSMNVTLLTFPPPPFGPVAVTLDQPSRRDAEWKQPVQNECVQRLGRRRDQHAGASRRLRLR